MGRPKRCAKRPPPYISYSQPVTLTTTTTSSPLDDPSTYIIVPESGVPCPREEDPCPCGNVYIPKGSGTKYIVVDNDYGSWGTYDEPTLVATLNLSTIDNYFHTSDAFIDSGQLFRTIGIKTGSADFYLDKFDLEILSNLNNTGDDYEDIPFMINNRIKVSLRIKETNEVIAVKYIGSNGSQTIISNIVLEGCDFVRKANLLDKTLLLEIYSVCDFETQKCLPNVSMELTTTTTTTTEEPTTTTTTTTTEEPTTTTTTTTTEEPTTTTTTTTTEEPTTTTTTTTTEEPTTTTTTTTTTATTIQPGFYCVQEPESSKGCVYNDGVGFDPSFTILGGPFSTSNACQEADCLPLNPDPTTSTSTTSTTSSPGSTTFPP